MIKNIIFALVVTLSYNSPSFAEKMKGLALTPPMGWNSWNHFGCNINENIIKEMADAMVNSGLKDAGYEYINIDDCWHGKRDKNGFIRADAKRFPSGIKAVADYVHQKGLKLGIYSDAGWKTCAGHPGSRGYEFQDAQTYANWGIDYLKYDWCNTEGLNAYGAYLTMREALDKAGRPIVFSICEWGDNQPWEWAGPVGHLWRTTGDIYPCWDCEYDHGTWSSWGVLKILDMRKNIRQYAGPDRWNDPDMMEVGNGLTEIEDRAHFSIWAMLAAPLIAGNDLRTMSDITKKILSNKAVIAINQDPLGVQGFKHKAANDVDYWFKPLSDGQWAMLIINRAESQRHITFKWKRERIKDPDFDHKVNFKKTVFSWVDAWNPKNTGETTSPLSATLAPHEILMVRLTPSVK